MMTSTRLTAHDGRRIRHGGLRGLAGAELAADPLAPKAPHFPAKAKRVIYLFLNGGPSQVDTFDPKPKLTEYHGKPIPAGN